MAHATRSLLITLSKAHVCLEKFVQIQLSMYTPVTLRSQTLLLANACTSPGLATEVMQFARLGSVNRRAEVMRYTVVYASALTHQSACQLLCVLVCQAPPTRKNWFASFSISNPFKFPFLLDALFWLGVVILGWLANRELTIFLFRF